jgi:hypothetical protein
MPLFAMDRLKNVADTFVIPNKVKHLGYLVIVMLNEVKHLTQDRQAFIFIKPDKLKK